MLNSVKVTPEASEMFCRRLRMVSFANRLCPLAERRVAGAEERDRESSRI